MTVNADFEAFCDKTLDRLRGGTKTDGYGNTVADWASPDTLTIPARYSPPILKVRLGSHAADEDMSGRDAVRHDFEAWVGNDDVKATDRVVIDGLTYEVMGQPGHRTDMDGRYQYTKILLREVSG